MILTTGEKIKRLRNDLNLKQSDLVDDQVSRNFISMLENGKTKLSFKVATIIAEKANVHCINNNLSIRYTPEYFLESIADQIEKQVNLYCEKLNNDSLIPHSLIIEIEQFIGQFIHYDIGALALELATYYDAIKSYDLEYTLIYKAFTARIPNFHDMTYIRLLLNLSYCCVRLEKYDETLKYCNYAITQTNCLTPHHFYAFSYNRLLAMLNLKQYEPLIEGTKTLPKHIHYTPLQQLNTQTLLALAHMELGNFSDSEKLLLEMHPIALKLGNSYERMNLSNLLHLYLKKNDTVNVASYYKHCVASIENEDQSNLHQGVKDMLVDLTKASILLGRYEEAFQNCVRSYDFCYKRNYLKTAIKCMNLIVEIHAVTLHKPYLMVAKKFLIDLFEKDQTLPLTASFLKLQKAFFKIGDCKTASELTDACLSLVSNNNI